MALPTHARAINSIRYCAMTASTAMATKPAMPACVKQALHPCALDRRPCVTRRSGIARRVWSTSTAATVPSATARKSATPASAISARHRPANHRHLFATTPWRVASSVKPTSTAQTARSARRRSASHYTRRLSMFRRRHPPSFS